MINDKKYVKIVSKSQVADKKASDVVIKNLNIDITENGTYYPPEPYTGFYRVAVNVEGESTPLVVTPTTSQQTFNPVGGVTYAPVTVSAVTNAIDSNIKAINIKSGVTILGVAGSVVELNGSARSVQLTSSSGSTFSPASGKNAITSITVTPNNQSKSITPSKSAQTFNVPSGYSGFGQISVSAVTNSIDANIVAGNIKNGVEILGVTGNYTGASASVIEPLSVTPSTSEQTISATPTVDGYAPITVSAVTSDIDANIVAGNIKSGVSILGVEGSVVELNGQTKTVNPSTSNQTISPSSPYNALTSVTVNKVTSSIDANIVSSNIKSGVSILGVAGSLTPINAQAKTVTPTTSQQTVTPSSSYNALSSVTVNAVTSSIDENITASNIKSGVSILGVAGNVVQLAGETKNVALTSKDGNTFTPSSGKNGITSITVSPTNQNKTITPTTSQQTISVPNNYSGFGTLTVNAVTSSIDSNIKAANIVSGVSILGVAGSATKLVGETRSVSITSTSGNTFTPSSGKNGITSITVTPTNQNRTVTPTKAQQTLSVNSGYSGNGTITVNAVTSSIDSNITAGNIKKGVSILGVTGTYSGPVDSGGKYYIRVVDYDGTILKQDHLNTGATFTLPTAPTHNDLVFENWVCTRPITNNAITVGYGDLIIGPTYRTASGKTEFDIGVDSGTGLTMTCNMSGSKDWGDGTTNSATTHTYASAGRYTIKCTGSTIPAYVLGSSGSSVQTGKCFAIRIGGSVTTIEANAFAGKVKYDNVETITIPNSVVTYNFGNLESIPFHYAKVIVYPDNSANWATWTSYSSLYGIIVYGRNITQFNANSAGSGTIDKISTSFPPSITRFTANSLSGLQIGVRDLDFTQFTSVPTADSGFFTSSVNYTVGMIRILVPSSLANAWKAAANWSNWASSIVGV